MARSTRNKLSKEEIFYLLERVTEARRSAAEIIYAAVQAKRTAIEVKHTAIELKRSAARIRGKNNNF